MVKVTRFMAEAAQGLTEDERYALNAYLSDPDRHSTAIEMGKNVYAILCRLENAFPKKGDVVLGKVKQFSTKTTIAGRKVKGKEYTTLVTVGHNAGTLLKKYREYSQQYDNLHVARTALGYALTIPI